MKKFNIGNHVIGAFEKPFIVAELSGNHNQSLDLALELVDKFVEAGADAIKLQTYTADTMTLNLRKGEFVIKDKGSLWEGENLYDLYQKAHTPWDWHEKIFQHCSDLGVICFSSPFDDSAVDFLETLNPQIYKLASFEVTDLPLVKKIALTGKPMIMSTGMATLGEIDDAVNTFNENGGKGLVLLQCTSSYPSSPKNSNINTIPHLRDLYGCPSGLSDHTLGIGVAVASVALGGAVIEKHVTLDRSAGGVDSAFSLEPHEFKSLVIEANRAWESLGEIKYGPNTEDQKSLKFRRSLYIGKDMQKGDIIDEGCIKRVRPGLGLSPKYLDQVVGRKVLKNVEIGTPVSWDIIG